MAVSSSFPIAHQGVAPYSRQSGVALILALLVVALASLAATAMIERQNIDVRRTANIIHSDQAYLYANAAEVFAKEVLKHDESKDTDDRGEPWFQPLPPTPVEGGSIGGNLHDLEADFPLNMLVNEDGTINADYVNVLNNLLQELGVDNHEQLAYNIADWIDKNDTTNNGLEDLDYMNLPKPYRTGNTEMASISELRMIGGLDEKGDTMARLLGKPLPQDANAPPSQNPQAPRNEPYLNVVPKSAAKDGKIGININTAPFELIMSLDGRIKEEAARKVISEREGDETGTKPFKDAKKFIEVLAKESNLSNVKDPKQPNQPTERQQFMKHMGNLTLTVKSEFFEMTANAQIGDSQLNMKSLLHRVDGNNGVTVQTLRRGLGEY